MHRVALGGAPPASSAAAHRRTLRFRHLFALSYHLSAVKPAGNDGNRLYSMRVIEGKAKVGSLMDIAKVLADLRHEKCWTPRIRLVLAS